MHIDQITITDPVYVKKEHLNAFDRFCMKFIRDERDLPFIRLIIRTLAISIPVIVYLFIPGRFSWWIAVPYLAINIGMNLGPFILMLHNTSHRKLFKKEYEFFNNFIPWIVGPIYGESPETYYGHHVGMHHPENNLAEDLSSTMRFQRDSIIDFLSYFFRFFLIGLPELAGYHTRKKRFDMLRRIMLGEFSFFLFCFALCFINWQATLAVFILPLVIARFGMMAGNWGQHAFIDANDPANCYKNSITCINSFYNQTCFNDGYHIGHHLRPAMHWTDMPVEFQKNKAEYAKNDAIVFEDLDFFVVWFLLMTHNYKKLAKQFVQLDANKYQTEVEIIAFLKERTKRIPMDQILKFSGTAVNVAARKKVTVTG